MPVTIAQPGDLSVIRRLLADCNLPGEDITSAHLKRFLVHRETGQLIGVVGLELRGEAALLRSLAVSERHRGRSVARELVRRAEEHAGSAGIASLYLLTTTADTFFAALGYRITQRDAAPASIRETAEFAGICPSSSVCMVKQVRSTN